MFFERIGEFSTKYRFPIIFFWIVTAVSLTLLAPNVQEIATSDMSELLPQNAPFNHADEVYQENFPDEFAPGRIVAVIEAEEGILSPDASTFEEQIDTEAGHFIEEMGAWLSSPDAPEAVSTTTLPTASQAALDLLVAPDNRVAIINIGLSYGLTDTRTIDALETIDEWQAANRPDNVNVYLTGSTPIMNATTSAAVETMDRTLIVTLILVILLLLLIYRSPVSPFVPLLSVTIAFVVTRGIVGFMADSIMTISTYAIVLLVVVMYGAGTDYNLFLISRFREEMADNIGVKAATKRTVGKVGETISSSAGTIFVGFMAMVFAEFGILNTMGPTLAIGIVVALVSGLMFVPALLAILGDRAFWPGKATHRDSGRLYEITSKLVSSRPVLTVIVIVAIMTPLALHALTIDLSYDMLDDLPDEVDTRVGYDLLQESMGVGNMSPLTIVVTERDPETIMPEINQLTEELLSLVHVTDVRSLNNPLGQNDRIQNLLRVDGQLNLVAQTAASTGDTADRQQMAGLIAGLQDYLEMLSAQFPEIADDTNLATLQALLENPAQLMQGQGEFLAALNGLAERFATIDNAYLMPTELANLFGEDSPIAQLVPRYLNGSTYKLTVILGTNPDSYAAMDTVAQIRDILETYEGEGDAVISGQTAITLDMRETMSTDLMRTIAFVMIGIFVVLLFMLRSVVAPLYLIGTVALSFGFTLGLTDLVFTSIFGEDGLMFFVPILTFVFLVALGIDYSIFLFGRIKEEVEHHGIREGVHVAVATTGAIITSAGIILAGTFAALLLGDIMGLVQLGFAVSVGVLVDTFIVRTILDPALATMFGKWTWWPGNIGSRSSVAEPGVGLVSEA